MFEKLQNRYDLYLHSEIGNFDLMEIILKLYKLLLLVKEYVEIISKVIENLRTLEIHLSGFK